MHTLTEALAFADDTSINYFPKVAAFFVALLITLSFEKSRLWLFRRTLRALAYGYLLRFPLLTAAAMVGLFAGAAFWVPSLLGNLFDVPRPVSMFLLSATALATALTVMTTWRLVVRNSNERFNLKSLDADGVSYVFDVSDTVGWRQVIWFAWTAVLLAGYACYFTITRNGFGPLDSARVILEALAGFAVALFFPWFAKKYLSNLRGLPEAASRRFRKVPRDIGGGYFEYDENGKVVRFWPGHVVAGILFALTFLFYLGIGIFKYIRLGREPYLPTLGYVLLLLMLLCWGLSGVAFFFDRYRIPVILPLLLLLTFTSLMPWSDHYYPVEPYDLSGRTREGAGAPRPACPPAPAATPDGKLIVVAANGGGIQAAAWTARVLTMLQHEFGDDFGKRLRVISSVSGGSVGAMYFANEYACGSPPPDAELEEIMKRVEGSSLDEVAWGLVYTDTIRLLTSYGTEWDRGRALEYAWLRRDLDDDAWPRRSGVLAGLSEWAADAEARMRPGMIFNTTNSDTGQRLPFATTPLPEVSEGRRTADALFESIGRDKDIPVVTAARLSASFPYVSPAARAGVSGEAAHVVDGGYYDNYGISSLVEWLDYELYQNSGRPDGQRITDVLFIEIRGSLTGTATVKVDGKEMTKAVGYDRPEPSDSHEFKSSRGWFYQAFAPLSTLINVRDTGQLSHNQVELKLLIEKWRDIDERKARRVTIRDVIFECDEAKPPLSWHLNADEKRRIEDNWKKELSGRRKQVGPNGEPDKDGLALVADFLGKPPRSRPAPPVTAQ